MKLIKLGVLLNILVLKCWAMTRIELQEFSDFLEKTSQLDLNLKSNPDIEADDDETALDNAWEESGKFEGDLVLNERQRRLIVEDVAEGLSRNGLRDSTKRWPNNEVVYYVQPEHFNEEQLQAIQNGIDDIAQASCVKFRPYHKGDRDAVVIQGSRRGCFSQVGYQGGYQVLNLSGRHPVGRGCFRHGTVVHELLHTLGFYHMQSSPDRDDYIDVIWENILQPARHNFRKYNTFAVSDFGVGYDYESVLHYSKKAFSSNGQDTLVPKQNDADIGQRVGLSQKDTQKLNKMYCDVDSNNDDTGSTISQKKRNQKESLKNKPFEGHGIGYHQGKTVIIKLPAAETHVLPDLSKFYTFDYFSKTSQAVPETIIQNSRFGGRIATSRDMVTHVENKTLKPSISSIDFPYKYEISTIREAKLSGKNNTSDLKSKENEEKYQSNTEKVKEIKSANEEENNMPRLDIADELKDINKILKSYVYPSEETGGYKIKNDYSTFSVPKKVVLHDEFDPNNRITRLYESGNQFDNNSGDIKSKSLKPIDSYEEEVDSPFENPFAVNKMNYFIPKHDPNSLKENLNRRNYYQQLNTQNRQNHPNKNNLNRHIESKMYTDDGDTDSYLNNRYNQNLLMHELHKNAPNYSQQSKWW